MRKLLTAITLTIALAFSTSLGLTGSAHAATAPAPAPHRVEIIGHMHVVGFDAAVARAHGYVIRTDAHGRQYSVKAGSRAGAAPSDYIGTSCGTTYMWYNEQGNRTVKVDTGFNLLSHDWAVRYGWTYHMQDPGGTSTHTHSGALSFQLSWETVDYWGGMTPGYSTAWVDTSSYALLYTGVYCYSGGPSDWTTIE